jgi:uncharacterized membrane protein
VACAFERTYAASTHLGEQTSAMQEFLTTPVAKTLLWVTILLVMLAVSYYLVRRFRDRTDDGGQTASDLLTNFREMRQEGDISETEFRTIKTVLGRKLQQELERADEEE